MSGAGRSLAVSLTLVLGTGLRDAQDETEAPRRIDAKLAELYPADGPGAVVLVARGGEVLLRKAYGLANLEHEVPLAPESVFRIASVTKLFTATAILQLAEPGELGLDDDVTEYLPDFPTYGETITIRHLLTHTSGIAEYLDGPDLRAWIRSELELAELVDSIADREPGFEPGKSSAYSNSNYVLLAAVIERVAGQPYDEFLREHIFEPAGMEDTRCGAAADIVPRRAAGYERSTEGFVDEKDYSMSILVGAGDALSTVDDLQRFFAALLAGQLLEPETLRRSIEPARLDDGKSTRFGYGWELEQVRGRRAAMKGGALSGFTHYVLLMPDDDVQVILLTNRAPEEERRPGRLCLEFAALALE